MEQKPPIYGVSECDLLIVIGARFSDRVTGNAQKFAQNAKIIQIDVDAAEMNKNVHDLLQVLIGDIKVVLDRLNERLEQQDHAEWVTKIQEYKEKYPLIYHKDVLSGPYRGRRDLSRRQRARLLFLQRSDSIRCGQHSFINIQNRVHS